MDKLVTMAYGLGAVTSLAVGLLIGQRLLIQKSVRWSDNLWRMLGAVVVAGVVMIWLGLDMAPLKQFSFPQSNMIEQRLFALLRHGQEPEPGPAGHALTPPLPLSVPLLSLLGAQQWLNTAPLCPEDLKGKVVLVNFWTYSCINCLRLLPYVRAWDAK